MHKPSIRTLCLIAAGSTVALWGVATWICLSYLSGSGSPLGRPNDFLVEAEPALRLLRDGHIAAFLQASPGYVGSLIARAPFGLAAMAANATWQTVYLTTTLPCLLAAPVLLSWLGWMRSDGVSTRWLWLSPLGVLLAINPVFIFCIFMGHPEDVVGASLAIAGVVQAARGRNTSSMILVGLATVNKSWAVVAVPVAFAVLPSQQVRALIVVCMTVLVVYIPVFAFRTAGPSSLGVSTGSIFHFPQLWYWFGPRAWVSVHAHELIVVSACACAASWRWLKHARREVDPNPVRSALILLSLVFLLRAALDPWDNVYYQLPFLMTVYALEVGRVPRMSVLATLLLFALTVPLSTADPGLRAAIYQVAVIPLGLAVGFFAYAPQAAIDKGLRRFTAKPGDCKRQPLYG